MSRRALNELTAAALAGASTAAFSVSHHMLEAESSLAYSPSTQPSGRSRPIDFGCLCATKETQNPRAETVPDSCIGHSATSSTAASDLRQTSPHLPPKEKTQTLFYLALLPSCGSISEHGGVCVCVFWAELRMAVPATCSGHRRGNTQLISSSLEPRKCAVLANPPTHTPTRAHTNTPETLCHEVVRSCSKNVKHEDTEDFQT